ncbi:AmmeMemoRadiSam system protein B [Candidatus Sororendozoicomonas aggregata]|uniref:AmmeMemoRadiSam system protein B n=1 Tax=Candidatus Sororendozoicomonas aggregata TaxID=3073239 RepID=UPI002ED48CE5
MIIRPPAVAGTFYPASSKTLQSMVGELLNDAEEKHLSPKMLVVPHAELAYSGPVAASAYRLLAPVRATIKRVLLLGPSHRLAFEGIALPSADAFASPLGDIPLDTLAMSRLLELSDVQALDAAHDQEHSLEVQLPFIKTCLEDICLIPLVIGDASVFSVVNIIEYLWGGDETLIIISTDLSHFHHYDQACQRDAQTVKAIEQKNAFLTGGQACGCVPLNGALRVAQKRCMEVITLDVRNSGDTTGDKDRVVGYGAFAIQ